MMETLAEDAHEKTSQLDDELLVEAEPGQPGPGGARLALASIGAFVLLVAIGGGVGLLRGPSAVAEVASSASVAAVTLQPTELAQSTIASTTDAPTIQQPTTLPPATTTAASDVPVIAVDDVVVTEPVAVVQGVTELNLELGDDVDVNDELGLPEPTPATVVEFLELPQAVSDRFTLRTGDSFAINISANDMVAGELRSVELTGLGQLAPGFSLDPDGTLAGTASDCGTWRAQYQLNSSNPATGTSWIEIAVSGCAST